MDKVRIITILFAVAILAGLVAFSMNLDDCLVTWKIGGSTAFTDDLNVYDTSAVEQIEKWPVQISDDLLAPITATQGFRVNGSPILYTNPGKTKAYVDEQFFSTLIVGDATNVSAPIVLGFVSTDTRQFWQPRAIVEFLLRTEIIRTYWHIESESCLTKETTVNETYIATIHGTHTYCTNECMDDSFQFQVTINKVTGEMVLQPTAK